MRRILMVAVIMAALAPAAWANFWGIKAESGARLTEVGGEVILYTGGVNIKLRASDWDLSVPVRTTTTEIQLRAGNRRGEYLGYHTEGKGQTVRLNTVGRKWEVTRVDDGFVIRAAEGKCKGYYLAAGDEVKQGDNVIGRKAILVEKPKKPLVFSIFEISN